MFKSWPTDVQCVTDQGMIGDVGTDRDVTYLRIAYIGCNDNVESMAIAMGRIMDMLHAIE